MGGRRQVETVLERKEERAYEQVPHIWGSISFFPFPPMGEWIKGWSRAGQEEDVVTADSSPEVILSNNQLLVGWKAGSFFKGTMF